MRFLGLILLAAGLSGCSLYGLQEGWLRGTWGLQPAIASFRPDRGAGAVYRIGEQVQFTFTLSRPGFVTLVTMDSDRNTYELERNVQLPAGTHTFPRRDDVNAQGARAAYVIDIPTGPQRVRLLYSESAGPNSIRFRGVYNGNEWDRLTRVYLEAPGAGDMAETNLYVTR